VLARLQTSREKTPFFALPTLDMRGFSRDRYRDDNTLSIGTRNALRDTPDVVRVLVQNGAEIVSVVPEEHSLEDVYMRLVEAEGVPA